MSIITPQRIASEQLPAGHVLTLTVISGSGAIVQRSRAGAVISSGPITATTSYGPYLHAMSFMVSCLPGGLLESTVEATSDAIQSAVSVDGKSIRFAPTDPLRAGFGIQSHASPYLGVVDEVWRIGYNTHSDDQVATEPSATIRFEGDYRTTHKGAVVRTTEHYLQLNGPLSQVAGGVTDGQFRPWFWAFSPDDTSGGRSGELAYGFLTTGKYRRATSGGGGLAIGSGDDNSVGSIMSFDIDAAWVEKSIQAQSLTPQFITAATTAANCVVTFAAPHNFEPGSNLTIFALAGGEWAPVVTGDVTGVSGLSITTSINNTGSAYLPATPTAGAYGARYPHDVALQIVAEKFGVGRTILSGDTDRFSIAGPGTFYGKVYYVEPGAAKTAFGTARLAFSSKITSSQAMCFTNTSQSYSFGFLVGNTSTFAIGQGRSTDSDFTSSNSILTFDAANQAIGIGGSVPNDKGFVRIRGATATRGQIVLNTSTFDPPADPGGAVIYCKNGATYIRSPSGTITLLAPA